MTNEVLIYSAYSGSSFSIREEDLKHMVPGQFPLKKKPNTSCKTCHGRGFDGRDAKNMFYLLCKCIKKVVDVEKMPQPNIV
jgi:predicted methyltransferase